MYCNSYKLSKIDWYNNNKSSETPFLIVSALVINVINPSHVLKKHYLKIQDKLSELFIATGQHAIIFLFFAKIDSTPSFHIQLQSCERVNTIKSLIYLISFYNNV